MGKKIIAYHGSNKNFDNFDSKYMSSSGQASGYGFYFTTSRNNAKMYAGDGDVMYTCEIDVTGLLYADKVSLSNIALKKIVNNIDNVTDGDFLMNYGDVNRLGRERVLQSCINDTLEYSNSDVEIVSEFVNAEGSFDMIAKGFIDAGYNCQILNKPNWGVEPHKVLIVLDANAITILDKEVLNNTNESYRAKCVSDMM